MKPSHFEGSESYSSNNVARPTINPSIISVMQQTGRYDIVGERLASPLYMWKATFKVAELYDVRVREYEFGHSVKNDGFRIRIELLAVCKTPPVGQGLVTTVGVKRDLIMNASTERLKPAASSVAIAKLSDR